MYKANISSILNFTPKTNPIYMKNRPAPAHSKQEPSIKNSSFFNVRSPKKALFLNLVILNNNGKYRPPPTNQIQYLVNPAPICKPKIINNDTQQYIDNPANKNKAILDIAYKTCFLLDFLP
ncbi:hypothetical protein LSGJ_00766 [Ligilactobacillus salivarius GJ-24]|uniref:Uncharacterized protein n=1 Tax=Ligilactobacillus salivarius GJ-24 TaxID=1041521 RepID=F7QU84_9LACO|nr:hypothetical protein LSGJ_00766 [Ligilactobacillus salivarius GJ-24]